MAPARHSLLALLGLATRYFNTLFLLGVFSDNVIVSVHYLLDFRADRFLHHLSRV
jgi:hypothetical protein